MKKQPLCVLSMVVILVCACARMECPSPLGASNHSLDALDRKIQSGRLCLSH